MDDNKFQFDSEEDDNIKSTESTQPTELNEQNNQSEQNKSNDYEYTLYTGEIPENTEEYNTYDSKKDLQVQNKESYDIYEDLEDDEYEKNQKKPSFYKTSLIIIGIMFFVIASSYIYRTNTGFIGEYKKNFSNNISYINQRFHILEYFSNLWNYDDSSQKKDQPKNIEKETYIMPFENASSSQYAVTPDGIVAVKSNYLMVCNSKGEVSWDTATSVINPILKAEGDYIMIAENGGKKICLYRDKKPLYAIQIENDIQNASLSPDGDVVVITKRQYYKGTIEVYNTQGNQIFSWNSGTDYVINADISESSRRVAAILLNTDSNINSNLVLFDITKTESYATQTFPNTVLFKCDFVNETLNLAADNRISGMSIRAKVLWDVIYENENFLKYVCDDEGNKLVLLESKNIPQLKVYSKSGSNTQTITTDDIPDYIDIKDNIILYNNNRSVLFGKPNKAQKYTASMDIKGLKIIDKNTFLVIYNNSLEFIKK